MLLIVCVKSQFDDDAQALQEKHK